ncbi:unnamed protein product, partial [Pylaiella littoralis]
TFGDAAKDGDGSGLAEPDGLHEVAGVVEEVCLLRTVWNKWTMPGKEEEMCLVETMWKKCTRVASDGCGLWVLVKTTRAPRRWRRACRRQLRHKNRRRREKR